ncbi:Pyruvate dehydrogenase [ubiquinone] [Marinomonas gallaica]|uniref:Pyruvate dehydrogenase [ubiquinone] n=1 Tax=Marinomonas gallaica TaxID=1806667 RepID=A0A1C3JUQ1_9GAMM|nr:thiamine pyrophosphate-dependent enzyme [Marinomonas gallaica]SBT18857.1 Pyruvate dehydrogenase [ubiquinone] [Marinomonas gallaica]SBT21812.1 Pyruvate dehydrogenase [ubiquinone] [Marinomonas gallaica]
MSKDVAEVIVETLANAGAKRCYGVVGDTINHFTDKIRTSEIDWVHVRHEEVGAFAAGAEAYMTQELALCAGTCGPGSLHFINGIFESHRNGSPLVFIASNVHRQEEGLNFPQEVDQTKLYEQCSVFCERISHPDQAQRIVTQAAQAALADQGVAVVVVNGDMFKEKMHSDMHWSVHRTQPVTHPNPEEMDKLVGLIDEAEKITLYAGIGAKGANEELIRLAKCLNAPIVHSTRSKEFIEPNNSYNAGMTGILGNKAGMEAVLDCDLLICLGTDFAYTQFYPTNAKIAQVNLDTTHLGKRCPIDLGLTGDVKATIQQLLPKLSQRSDEAHLDKALKQWQKDLEGYRKEEVSDHSLIHPQTVTRRLNELVGDNAIFTADGGSPMVWLLRHLEAKGSRRFLTSLSHGTMANAYPQAMGIAKAYPDRPVIALCGDGGMTMLMGDLLTLVQENIPVKLLIYNNESLGFVEMEQRVEGQLDSFTKLQNPDFAEVAKAMGLDAWRVEQPEDIDNAMKQWLASDKPALLDVKVSPMELVMPPKIEAGQVASTALFGIKAVLNGRMSEVTDLLKDNFLR